jgi:integrase
MRWSELDLDRATWTIPAHRAKNGNAHIVPLSPIALGILRALPRFAGSDFVFTTTGNTAVSGFGRLKERLAPAATSDWRFHDIRRTVATNLAALRVPPHVIEAVLNHQSGIVSGVAAVYNRHAYLEEKSEALGLWALKMSENGSQGARSTPTK